MSRQIKVMVVMPENNSTIVPEISALCPDLAPLAVARVKRPPRTLLLEDLPAYAEATLEAVKPFEAEALKNPWDLVIYGCTAAGFLGGPQSNAQMVERLSERTGAAVVSTASAMVEVLHHADVSETAVVTPYLAPVNDGLRNYLAASGIMVERLDSFFCNTTAELGAVTEDQVIDLARRTLTPASVSLFIACSQLPTLRSVSQLRRELDIPVWSSIQATAWAAARTMNDKGLAVSLNNAA